eukprot:Hpha_TRINITY_DN24161_c0_g1::TRINITY_DN24161_c0_g1_i1::g.9841::m.9841
MSRDGPACLIFVMLDGKEIPLEMPLDATIRDVVKAARLPVGRRLVFGDITFPNDCTEMLCDLGIGMESVFFVEQTQIGLFSSTRRTTVTSSNKSYEVHKVQPTIRRDDIFEVCLTVDKPNQKMHDIGVLTSAFEDESGGRWIKGNLCPGAMFCTRNIRINGIAERTKIRMRKEGMRLMWFKEDQAEPYATTSLECEFPITVAVQSYGVDAKLSISWQWL